VVKDGVIRLLEAGGIVDVDLLRPAHKVAVKDSVDDRLAYY
jgi:hypothetical protein